MLIVIGDDQGGGASPAQPMSLHVPGALINNDIATADISPGQARGAGTLSSSSMETSTAAQPISQEAPSASLSHTRVGTLSLNTLGNDVNNSTVHDHSRHTGNGNTMVFNIENMVFNHFWPTESEMRKRNKKLAKAAREDALVCCNGWSFEVARSAYGTSHIIINISSFLQQTHASLSDSYLRKHTARGSSERYFSPRRRNSSVRARQGRYEACKSLG
ncbi:hypothetical protein BT96DRAFT_992522 [Gymnopus androsaceus JB14]|uniref:Uncharacterized protein n=1 Tax=Gymnopus androsaceus JB14 TaxID=1447944 RepID=A0A6A4HPN5_9AGAR|nr:hypothetical protein BT96DRAFT_992522 [Gymnopus androsaceus JB14]